MARMRSLRKGETQVKEWGHTVLCGWGSHSIAFIHQICLANASGQDAEYNFFDYLIRFLLNFISLYPDQLLVAVSSFLVSTTKKQWRLSSTLSSPRVNSWALALCSEKEVPKIHKICDKHVTIEFIHFFFLLWRDFFNLILIWYSMQNSAVNCCSCNWRLIHKIMNAENKEGKKSEFFKLFFFSFRYPTNIRCGNSTRSYRSENNSEFSRARCLWGPNGHFFDAFMMW